MQGRGRHEQGSAPKRAFVVGGLGTLGSSIAAALEEESWEVAIFDVRRGSQHEVASKLAAVEVGRQASQGEIRSTFLEASASIGDADALVIASGAEGPVGPFEELSETDLDDLVYANIKTAAFWIQAALPRMKLRRSGSIVVVSSISGVVGTRNLAGYALVKHAVVGLTRSVALELYGSGVRINAVCPGPTESPMMYRIAHALAELEGSPRGVREDQSARWLDPAEVSSVVCFLCGDAVSAFNGATLMVDDGFTAR